MTVSLNLANVVHTVGVYAGFNSIKCQEISTTLPGWNASLTLEVISIQVSYPRAQHHDTGRR